jgi:hypothetical protein
MACSILRRTYAAPINPRVIVEIINVENDGCAHGSLLPGLASLRALPACSTMTFWYLGFLTRASCPEPRQMITTLCSTAEVQPHSSVDSSSSSNTSKTVGIVSHITNIRATTVVLQELITHPFTHARCNSCHFCVSYYIVLHQDRYQQEKLSWQRSILRCSA